MPGVRDRGDALPQPGVVTNTGVVGKEIHPCSRVRRRMKQHGLHSVSQSAEGILERLVAGLEMLGGSRKIDNTNGAFMPVCVERVEETEHGPVFSVAHYFEQNGDLVADPDVTLLRAADGEFYPLTYQDARAYRRSVELDSDGGVRANRRMQAALAQFVGVWMKNIGSQQGL